MTKNKFYSYVNNTITFNYEEYKKCNLMLEKIMSRIYTNDIYNEIINITDESEEYKEFLLQMIPINRCIVCNIDLGDCNPRQYCMKTYCPYDN